MRGCVHMLYLVAKAPPREKKQDLAKQALIFCLIKINGHTL